VIPPQVSREFARFVILSPRFENLKLPPWVREQPVVSIPLEIRSASGLNLGETAALALALEICADAVLLDERRGREFAMQLGLQTIGILGILLQEKRARLINEIGPVLEQLERDALFWIGPLLKARVLNMANE
jgi:predicted nucleic acid-binding protein